MQSTLYEVFVFLQWKQYLQIIYVNFGKKFFDVYQKLVIFPREPRPVAATKCNLKILKYFQICRPYHRACVAAMKNKKPKQSMRVIQSWRSRCFTDFTKCFRKVRISNQLYVIYK